MNLLASGSMLQVLEWPIKSGFTIEICDFLFSVRASQLTHVREKKSFPDTYVWV